VITLTTLRFSMQRTLCQLLCLIVSAFSYSPRIVTAQTQPESTRQAQRLHEQETLERQFLEQTPDARIPTLTAIDQPKNALLPKEIPCFTIHSFVLVNANTPHTSANPLPHAIQQLFTITSAALPQFQGQCIGQQGIRHILQRLTERVVANGYATTRFTMAQQDLSTGTLTITMIPGIVSMINFDDQTASSYWRSAFPLRTGDVLNLRDLEQGLEQMQHASSQDAVLDIRPGIQSGESEIVIHKQNTHPWHAILTFDNSGSMYTGKYQLGLHLGYDNLLDRNDVLSFGVTSNVNALHSAQGSQSTYLAYWLPYGYWTLNVWAYFSQYKETALGEMGALHTDGDSSTAEVSAHYLFHRNQTQKNSVQLRIGKRWGHTLLEGTSISNQQRNTHYLELGFMHTHYLGSAQLDLYAAQRLSYGRYIRATSTPNVLTHYGMQMIDASLSLPFKHLHHAYFFTTSIHAQHSHKALYATEHLGIGSRYSVRGFDEITTLNAESGFYWRNEISRALGASAHMIYAGLDIGQLYGANISHLPGHQLSGATIGLRGAYQSTQYDLAISMPLSKPKDMHTHTPNLTFSLSHHF
jgi:hemolysin activation/secretion protein